MGLRNSRVGTETGVLNGGRGDGGVENGFYFFCDFSFLVRGYCFNTLDSSPQASLVC